MEKSNILDIVEQIQTWHRLWGVVNGPGERQHADIGYHQPARRHMVSASKLLYFNSDGSERTVTTLKGKCIAKVIPENCYWII